MAVDMAGIVFIGAIFVVILVVVIAAVAFALTRTHSPSLATFPAMRETPLQLLDRRFAAGEIDAEEYKRARDLLAGGGPKT
jgi:putative membrane protein